MILVTGASGFIGGNLVPWLSSAGMPVMPLHHARAVRVSDNHWECDLTRPGHLEKIRKTAKAPDTVVHLAGRIEIALRAASGTPNAPPLPANENLSRIYAVNVAATANILNYCLTAGVRHLIFASSQSVYGMPRSGPLTESSPCDPLEHYAMSKLCCEQLLRVGGLQGLSVTILRFPGVFSEERRSGMVYRFCEQALRSGEISVRADYPLPIDVIHVSDAVSACMKAIAWGGRIGTECLNIATGEPCNLNMIADLIAGMVPGCRVRHSDLPQPVVSLDPSRAQALLQWKAVPREDRFKSMIDSLRSN